VAFLQEVRKRIPKLFFILNKIDYLTPEERETALGFLKKTLNEQVGCEPNTKVFPLSARQGLRARQTGDETLWGESGLDKLEAHLVS